MSKATGYKTSARTIRAAERRHEVVKLRKEGMTGSEIAERLGYAGRSGPEMAILTEMKLLRKAITEDVEELRRDETAKMLAQAHALIKVQEEAKASYENSKDEFGVGDPNHQAVIIKAAETNVRVSERVGSLWGLDKAIINDGQKGLPIPHIQMITPNNEPINE